MTFKKPNKFEVFFLLILFAFSPLFLQPLKAADTSNLTVSLVSQRGEYVIYRVVLIHTGAATDDVRSQAISLDYLDIQDATIQCKSLVGGTRDVNIDIEGSNQIADSTFEQYQTRTEFDDFSADQAGDELTAILDRDFYKSVALASIATIYDSDEGLITAVADSDGTIKTYVYKSNDQALRCRYIRVVSDGQAGNEATVSTEVLLRFRKKNTPSGVWYNPWNNNWNYKTNILSTTS